MPAHGYRQDLFLLMNNCLVPWDEMEPPLTDHSTPEELSAITWADMLMLNEAIEPPLASKTELQPVEQEFLISFDPTPSDVAADHVVELGVPQSSQFTLQYTQEATQTSPTITADSPLPVTLGKPSPLPLPGPSLIPSSPLPQGRRNSPSAPSPTFSSSSQAAKMATRKIIDAVLSPQGIAPTLKTRTNEEVISELRKSAPAAWIMRDRASLASQGSSSSGLGLPEIHLGPGAAPHAENDDEEDSDSGEEGNLYASKPRKLTERKKRQNAVADAFLRRRTERSIKEGSKLNVRDEEQSARWLINQSENRQIISSPRDYQTELFEKAKEQNIIAVLDTGSGKTLIAVLLLRHIFAQELEDRALGKPHRISFFLVDSVQLVFQQHAVLKANLDQPMDMFCGEMNCDLWDRKIWAKHFAKNMVIVCTAEVLRQCLHHSFISMDQINLLIFDEAHHAKKDHAYARIIKDFYIPHKQKNISPPKIFGMTASPVDARTDVKRAALELESILDSQIATAPKDSSHANRVKPKENAAEYDLLGPRFQTPLYRQMHERFKTNIVLKKPLEFAYEATRELGSWCADEVWRLCLTEEETKKLQAKTERKYHAKKIQEPLAVLEKSKAEVHEAQQIVNTQHTFAPPDYSPLVFDPISQSWRPSPSSNLSSKVVLLIGHLRERFERPTDDKCIVFVKQRYTARLLAKLFSEPNIGTPHLHVSTLIGTRSGNVGDLNFSFKEQVLTMSSFRKGTLNCLFATSVGEEGLDVPDCNLIIRFDLCETLIKYIQSRGRARHANSRFIHMIERGNQEHYNSIKEIRQNEKYLKSFCDQLPEDRILSGSSHNIDYFLSKEKNRKYVTPAGATLNYKMSLTILANFVDSLPSGQEANLQPDYIITIQNKNFICEAILPEGSPIRGAIGRPATTKQVAKCSAAFETCLLLIKGKHLDQWLIPTYTKQLPLMRNARLAVDEKKKLAYDMRTKPTMWSETGLPNQLFVTVILLSNPEAMNRHSQPLALLTRSPLPVNLPSFFLHFAATRHSEVRAISLSRPLQVAPEVVAQMDLFTLCIFDDVFSKGYESHPEKMPYFLAPALPQSTLNTTETTDPSGVLDWETLQSVADHQRRWTVENRWENKYWQTEPDEFFKDKFIVDPFDGSRKLWSVGVTKSYKALDPVPPKTAPRSGARKNNANIMEYSCSLWQKARSRRTFDPEQRVIEAEFISLRRNLLDEFDVPEDEYRKPTQCFVILEPLKVSPLPAPIVAMAYVFPAIIHRIESYIIALEACELVHLKIRPDLALEALTKDADNSGEHDSEQVNFQKGMGKNYERLEFLGDCFLKMATSLSLYGIYPDKNEFTFHVDRMVMICNANLKTNAVKLKLYEYIRSASFNRRAWYPEGLVQKTGKAVAAPNTHRLGDKTIADVCESLIGAALLTGHETKDMDNAVRAVTEFVCDENHRVACFADYYKLYQKPKYQLAPATESQKNLAAQLETKYPYHFKYPRLARSAFTHPSYPFMYEHVPSYQRLEFLGDSLLDMACVNFLFHHFPDKDPQWMTEHKMAMVSNQFLGALCVSLEFHTHLLLLHSAFMNQITTYVTEITEARRQAEEDAILAGKARAQYSRDYWCQVRQPPKCLPDVVEAYIGAIFVDSEYNYSVVERFFDTQIKPFFEDMMIYDTFANKHPTTFLTKFLQINMGCVDWSLVTRDTKEIDGSKPSVVAMVMIHNEVVADAEAESGRYAKVNAAKRAMNILSGLPLMEFREKFGCCCTADEIEGDDVAGHGTAV